MKILHIYPNGDMQLARYVGLLTKSMQESADIEAEAATDDAKELKHLLARQDHPDILHLHGAVVPSHLRTPVPPYPRLVVSPHGAKMDKSRLNAFAVVARSPMEYARLEKQQYTRIELVRNPVLTRTTTWDEAARKIRAIYQKVIDSDVLELMDADTRQTLKILLKAGICGDKRWVDGLTVGQTDWRKLLIYAEYEGVAATVHKGIVKMGLSVPTVDVMHIPAYLPAGYQKPVSLEGHSLTDIVDQTTKGKPLTLSLLVDMHHALMNPELDEEMLMQELSKERLTAQFACMLQLLREHTLLDEGFMPCTPVDNRNTKQLNNILNKHLHIQ